MKIIRVQIQGVGDTANHIKRIAMSFNPKKHTTIDRFILHASKLFKLDDKKYQLSIDGYAISQKDKAKILKEDEIYRLTLQEDSAFSEEESEEGERQQQLKPQLGKKKQKQEKKRRKEDDLIEKKHNKIQENKPSRSNNPYQQLDIAESSEESEPQPKKITKLPHQIVTKPPLDFKPFQQSCNSKTIVLSNKRVRSVSCSSESSLTPSVHEKPRRILPKQTSSKPLPQNTQKRNSIEEFVCGQIHYYFSDKNYYTDSYLQMLQHHKPNYYISIACFLRFPKIKKFCLTEDQLLRYLSEDDRLDSRNYLLNYPQKTLRKRDLIPPTPIEQYRQEQE